MDRILCRDWACYRALWLGSGEIRLASAEISSFEAGEMLLAEQQRCLMSSLRTRKQLNMTFHAGYTDGNAHLMMLPPASVGNNGV